MKISSNQSSKPYNTFGIDLNFRKIASVNSIDDLKEVYLSSQFSRMNKIVLGGGSNILFTKSISGLVVKNEIYGIEVLKEMNDKVLVGVGAGESWHGLVLWAIDRGYGGIENLSLIPGTVGASPIQNIGAYGTEIKDVFHSLKAYEIATNKEVFLYKEDCKFGYRESIFKNEEKNKFVIIRVNLLLEKNPTKFNIRYGDLEKKLKGQKPTLKKISQSIIEIRLSKLPDPCVLGNAGSFFKNSIIGKSHFEALQLEFSNIKYYQVDENHYKISTAWMLDNLGWKGTRYKNVGVHLNQPLVLVNYGGGTGTSILSLAKKIQKSVLNRFGIELEIEVNIY